MSNELLREFIRLQVTEVIKKCRKKDKESGKPWCLYTKDGKRLLGRHKTKKDAHEQEYAIHKNK